MQQQYSFLYAILVCVVLMLPGIIQIYRLLRSQPGSQQFEDTVSFTEKRWLAIAVKDPETNLTMAMLRAGLSRGPGESFANGMRRLEFVQKSCETSCRAVSIATAVDQRHLATWVDKSEIHIRSPHALEHVEYVEELASAAANGMPVRIHDTERPPPAPLLPGTVLQLRRPS